MPGDALLISGFSLAEHDIKITELGARTHVFLNDIERCLILTKDVRDVAVFITLVAIVGLIQLIAA